MPRPVLQQLSTLQTVFLDGLFAPELYKRTNASLDRDTEWHRKAPVRWTSDEVLNWMYHTAAVEQGHDDVNMADDCGCWDVRHVSGENWQGVDGRSLSAMPIDEFRERDQRHGVLLYEMLHRRSTDEPYQVCDGDNIPSPYIDGFNPFDHDHQLHQRLHEEKTTQASCPCRLPSIASILQPPTQINNEVRDFNYSITFDFDCRPIDDFDDLSVMSLSPLTAETPFFQTCSTSDVLISSDEQLKPYTPRHRASSIESTSTNYASGSSDNGKDQDNTGKSRPVKNRKERKTKINAIHLWQFMLALLADARCNPDLIKWLDESDGVFRIVRSAETARLWGVKKNNKSMTFDKMSRALRWCRDNGFLADVPKNRGYPKKLCFRFGDRAKNWNGLSSTPINEIIGVSGLPLDRLGDQ